MKFYIDPGTGSMLFTILLGIIGASFYYLRIFVAKLRSGFFGKNKNESTEKIPFVIYSDDKRYWNIFEPVCREMNKRGKEVVYLAASSDDPVFECQYENVKAKCIGKGNRSFSHLNYLNAVVLLSTTPGLNVYQWKKSRDVDCYIHIMHSADEVTLYRMFGIDYYDSVLISADYHLDDIRELEALRGLPEKEVVKVGIPYMDEMATKLEEDLKNSDCPEKKRPVVVLAPSWGSNSIFNVFGDKIIKELVDTGYEIIIRPHPQSFESEKELIDTLMQKFPGDDTLSWNRDTSNYEVLKKSDILISDFSGVIYDFSLVYNKPVIYTNPNIDLSVYDAWWQKNPLHKNQILPLIGCELTSENISNIKEVIDNCLNGSEYAEGKGTERVVDYILEKLSEFSQEVK